LPEAIVRNSHYYLLKLARLSGWLLLPLMVLFIGTGFALCGMFGFSRWLDLQTALAIHQVFDWPLVGLFLLHATITSYFAMRRWGWIKNRKPDCPKEQESPDGPR
jgi:thiosulfate reductase cytochrome b subunit